MSGSNAMLTRGIYLCTYSVERKFAIPCQAHPPTPGERVNTTPTQRHAQDAFHGRRESSG